MGFNQVSYVIEKYDGNNLQERVQISKDDFSFVETALINYRDYGLKKGLKLGGYAAKLLEKLDELKEEE